MKKHLLLCCLLFGVEAALARGLDDFDDGMKTGWTDFATGLGGTVTEAFGWLMIDVPAGWARGPVFVSTARAGERLAVQDGQTLALQVDLAYADSDAPFAVLAWVPDSQPVSAFSGYFIAKSAREIRVGKGLHKYFWKEQALLKNDNVTLALSLELTKGTVALRARVLDKDAGNAVLFDRSFVDSPAVDPLAVGTDEPAAPFTGEGQFVLMGYAEHQPGDPTAQMVAFDQAEVSTPAPTNLWPVIHDPTPTNMTSFLPLAAHFRFFATDDKRWWDPDPSAGGGVGFTQGPFAFAQSASIVSDSDHKTLAADTLPQLAPNRDYTARLLAVDAEGGSNVVVLHFDTFCPADRVIEVEDYDFGGGQFIDLPVVVAENSGLTNTAYRGQTGVPETDFHVSGSNAAGSIYRPQDPVPTKPSLDYLRPQFLEAGGPGAAVFDYDAINLAAGDSLIYTRTFPDNDYWVYLREAVVNLDQAEAVLERIPQDHWGNPNPTLLGHFEGQRSGFEYRNVPLTDTDGRPVKVHLNGVERLRLRQMTDTPEDGRIALNYLVFAPEVDVCAWVESAADPAGPYAQDLTATMQGSTVTIKPLTGQARFFRLRSNNQARIINVRRTGDALVFDVGY